MLGIRYSNQRADFLGFSDVQEDRKSLQVDRRISVLGRTSRALLASSVGSSVISGPTSPRRTPSVVIPSVCLQLDLGLSRHQGGSFLPTLDDLTQHILRCQSHRTSRLYLS